MTATPLSQAPARARPDLLGMLWTLARTDFKERYHGGVMGYLWALLKPLATFLVLLGVFSFIFAESRHYVLNLLLGLFLWNFFCEGTKVGLISLKTRGFLLDKTQFPRWVLVVASLSNALITVLIVSVVLVVSLCVAGRPPDLLAIGLYLLCLLLFLLIVVGFSLGTCVLFLRYRDLDQVWDVLSQAGFFIAPIIYPLSILPERLHFYLYLWPPTPVIQYSRMLLVEGQYPTPKALGLLFAVTAVTLVVGVLLFRRLAPSAAEYL